MSPRARKLIFLLAASFVGILGLGFLAGVAAGFWTAHTGGSKDMAMFWSMGVFVVAAMVIAMVVSVVWMRSIDEAAREAHKAAWFWGGTGGMSVGMIAIVLASLPPAERFVFPSWFDGRTDPAAYAATGAFGILFLMLIGYAIVWAWWWLARR